MERYRKGQVLGEGTYGKVVKAEEIATGRVVAIKKVRVNKIKEGMDMTALREIKVLKELHHPHILNLYDVFHHKRNLNLVMDYMVSDLEMVIKDKACRLNPADIKAYMHMTLQAVAHCHQLWVVHRDLKPNNLLLAPDGSLKLADFGLARIVGSPDRQLTNQVYQRWYRAPELLFGCKQYGTAADLWALGCIFAELMLRKPYIAGSSDLDQLGRVFSALGTPTEEEWKGMHALPDFVEFNHQPKPDKKLLFKGITDDALDLLNRLLTFDPNARITAEQALAHRYFKTSPAMTPVDQLQLPAKKKTALQRDLEDQAAAGLPPRCRGSLDAALQAPRSINNGAGGEGGAPGGAGGDSTARTHRTRISGGTAMDQDTPASEMVPMAMAFGDMTGSGGGGGGGGGRRDTGDTTDTTEGAEVEGRSISHDDRRYLRKRKMELDEALFNASQHGV